MWLETVEMPPIPFEYFLVNIYYKNLETIVAVKNFSSNINSFLAPILILTKKWYYKTFNSTVHYKRLNMDDKDYKYIHIMCILIYFHSMPSRFLRHTVRRRATPTANIESFAISGYFDE